MKVSIDLDELDKYIDERIQMRLDSVLNVTPKKTWSLSEFAKNTNFKSQTIAREFLYFYENKLTDFKAIEPHEPGSHWKINVAKMLQWLEINEADVWKNKRKWRRLK